MVASARLKRAKGFAWEVRYSEMRDGKRHQRIEVYDGATYQTEKDVRKAIERTVSQINSRTPRGTHRHKVPALALNVISAEGQSDEHGYGKPNQRFVRDELGHGGCTREGHSISTFSPWR
jgi:hypothetical protein